MVNNIAMGYMELALVAIAIMTVCFVLTGIIFRKAKFSTKWRTLILASAYGIAFLFGSFVMADDPSIDLPRQVAGAATLGVLFMGVPSFVLSMLVLIGKAIHSKDTPN